MKKIIISIIASILPIIAIADVDVINAEDIVKFKPDSFACDTEDNFNAFLKHIVAHEKTKAYAMFNDSTCIMIPTDEKYRILSTDYHFLSGNYVEFAGVKSDSSNGFWTISDFIKEVVK